MIGFGVTRTALYAAMQFEDVTTYGQAVGLTREQAQEVTDYWTWHHHGRTSAVDWDEIRESMALRAMGEPWRPRDIVETRLLRSLGLR